MGRPRCSRCRSQSPRHPTTTCCRSRIRQDHTRRNKTRSAKHRRRSWRGLPRRHNGLDPWPGNCFLRVCNGIRRSNLCRHTPASFVADRDWHKHRRNRRRPARHSSIPRSILPKYRLRPYLRMSQRSSYRCTRQATNQRCILPRLAPDRITRRHPSTPSRSTFDPRTSACCQDRCTEGAIVNYIFRLRQPESAREPHPVGTPS